MSMLTKGSCIPTGFEIFIKVDAIGFSGGIWVLWKPRNILVEPIGTAFHEIHFKVQVINNICILTAMYASPKFSIKKQLWEKLTYLASFINLPWLLIGDFNDISKPNEKFGGSLLIE